MSGVGWTGPQLEHAYKTNDGDGAEFRMAGMKVRAERHLGSVVVGWQTGDSPIEAVGRLASLPETWVRVNVLHGGIVEALGSDRLSAMGRVAELPDIELVRIDRDVDSVLWEARHTAPSGELAVVAGSWDAARAVALTLGASDVSEAVTAMAERLQDY